MNLWALRHRAPLALALAIAAPVAAQSAPAPATDGQTAQVAPAGGYPYLLHLPRGYAASGRERWPLMVFLHGSGERGDQIDIVKVHGPPRVVGDDPALPFIVISPQLPADRERWDPAALDATLDAALRRLRADPDRIVLTGLSLGGMATWDWAMARPDRFAAIAPVAALADPANACRLTAIPTWVFHGDGDPVVPLAGDMAMVDAVRACGGDPRLTVYPATGHDSWTRTYADPAFYLWLLEQRRPGRR